MPANCELLPPSFALMFFTKGNIDSPQENNITKAKKAPANKKWFLFMKNKFFKQKI
jgi:hypothetical protein